MVQTNSNGDVISVVDNFTIPAAAPPSPPPPSPVLPSLPPPSTCGQLYTYHPGAEAQPSNAFGGVFFDLIAGCARGSRNASTVAGQNYACLVALMNAH